VTVVLDGAAATDRAGRALAPLLAAGDAIALIGDLGAGKTALTEAIVAGLGGPAVASPTFALIHEYRGGRLPVWHVDLYRIEREAELVELGLDELFERGGVVIVEWADRFADAMPRDHLRVTLAHDGDRRRLALDGTGERGRALAAAWAAALDRYREASQA
jgi:tRNA threonylcarbamoyladenosine biosynthesis protein TsaE